MKHLFFLMLLLLGGLLSAQDIILDPIEQNPETPSARSLASGNWGYGAYDLDRLSAEIQRRAARPVVVYVFDTGGKYTHPGLAAVAWNEKGRTYTGEPLPDDGNGHSTHVAGTYAGTGGAGPVGICDALRLAGKIRIVPLKVLSNSGSGSFANVTAAAKAIFPEVQQLIADGWFVVYNFSMGGGTAVIPSVEAELANARKAGVFIAAAAGNTGGAGVIYPASGPASHATAALSSSLTRAYFSTTGPQVEYAAPGQGIYSTYPPDVYRELSGTSMATPHAGAVAALIASVYPTASAEAIAAHIEKYSRDLGTPGRDEQYGYGFANIAAMLANAPGTTPGPDPDPDPDPPKPDPPVEYPVRTMTMKPVQTFSVPWSAQGDPKQYRLTFQICVDYTHKQASDKAADALLSATRDHFQRRGYLMPSKTDEWEAAFWVAYFYKTILGQEGFTVDVECMSIQGSGITTNRVDFTTPKNRRKLAELATKSNAITYTY